MYSIPYNRLFVALIAFYDIIAVYQNEMGDTMALDLRYGKDDENRNLRTTFDTAAENYDAARPRYCPELFGSILDRAALKKDACLLEIGPGTGQATQAFLETGCPITAVELGENMAQFLREKYAARKQLHVWQGDFLEFPEDQNYDLIYSATAFHWIPREPGLAKVKRLLKPGGTLALFWNHPTIDPGCDETVQQVYSSFGHTRNSAKPFDGSSCPDYVKALEDAGFRKVHYRLFHGTRVLSGAQYVQLMRTYSDHIALPEEKRTALEQAMQQSIETVLENKLIIRDVMDLYLAAK